MQALDDFVDSNVTLLVCEEFSVLVFAPSLSELCCVYDLMPLPNYREITNRD